MLDQFILRCQSERGEEVQCHLVGGQLRGKCFGISPRCWQVWNGDTIATCSLDGFHLTRKEIDRLHLVNSKAPTLPVIILQTPPNTRSAHCMQSHRHIGKQVEPAAENLQPKSECITRLKAAS